jgi:predicted CXXCH cytochrome family protein
MKKTLLISALLLLVAAPACAEQSWLPAIKKDCSICHTLNKQGTMVRLKLPPTELCIDCHRDRVAPAEHPVDVEATMKVRHLPLDDRGRVTCITCHEPHGLTGQPRMLRARPSELCAFCHDKK